MTFNMIVDQRPHVEDTRIPRCPLALLTLQKTCDVNVTNRAEGLFVEGPLSLWTLSRRQRGLRHKTLATSAESVDAL